MSWKDSSGRALSDYPHPSVAVDVALMTVREGGLWVVLHQPEDGYAAGQWALPGTFVRMKETLREAALRALRDKAGVSGRAPRQLQVFDAVDRDERGRVLSAAHVDLVAAAAVADATLAPYEGERLWLPQRQRRLPYDHDAIVAQAVTWARDRYRDAPDPEGLLGETFTMAELRALHAAVLGEHATPQKDTFRRRMEGRLIDAGEMSTGNVGKPARLFRRG